MEELYRDLECVGYPCVLVSRLAAGESGRSTRAVRIDNWAEAESWTTAAMGAGRNLYVLRNPILDCRLYRRDGDGQRFDSGRWGNPPLLDDIAAVRWLPIDIDPPTSERMDDATRQRVLMALEALDRVCPLRFVMDSGRGVQAQVELARPPAREDTERWKAALGLALRIEQWLADRLKGCKVDSISNVNRFTRLVGTVNQKTGCKTKFIQWSPQNVIGADPALVLPDYAAREKRIYVPAERVAVSSDRHVQDVLRELGHGEPNSVIRGLLAELEQGPGNEADLNRGFRWWADTGENPLGDIDPDRSNRQHHFANQGVRMRQPVRALYAALVNPAHTVLNAHVLEKRKDAHREAVRNLAKAIVLEYFDAEWEANYD